MRFGTLFSLAVLAVLVTGGAHAQKYDELLKAVSQADCERSEAETFQRYVCREGRVVWYFTKEGMAAHPAYQVLPVWGASDRMPGINGSFGRSSTLKGSTREAALAHGQVFGEWDRDVVMAWHRTQPRLEEDRLQMEQQRKKRLERRLWPAE